MSVSLNLLRRRLGTGNQDYLKETCYEALAIAKWNGTFSIRTKTGLGHRKTLSLRAYQRWHLYVCLPALAPETLQPARIYTKLNLHLQNRFTSRHALILWEVCFDYFDTDRDQGETPFIPLEMFRELMGLERHEYPAYKVLQPVGYQTRNHGN